MRRLLSVLSYAMLFTITMSHAYFNRIMGCQEFCKMLSQSQIHQFYCMIEICEGRDLRSHVMSYAKRGQGQRDLANPSWRILSGIAERSNVFLDKKDKEYWDTVALAELNH